MPLVRHLRARGWTAIALMVSMGLLRDCGRRSSRRERYRTSFSFEAAAVVATAIATVALAALTAVLATATRADADSSKRLVELTAQDQRDRNRGIVVVLRPHFDNFDTCAVDIKNVGLGPAVYLTTRVELRDAADTPLRTGFSSNDYALASGEESQVDIDLTPTPYLTPTSKVERLLVWGTFLGRGAQPEHFLWNNESNANTFGLWGEAANPENMRSVVGRDDWAQLHLAFVQSAGGVL